MRCRCHSSLHSSWSLYKILYLWITVSGRWLTRRQEQKEYRWGGDHGLRVCGVTSHTLTIYKSPPSLSLSAPSPCNPRHLSSFIPCNTPSVPTCFAVFFCSLANSFLLYPSHLRFSLVLHPQSPIFGPFPSALRLFLHSDDTQSSGVPFVNSLCLHCIHLEERLWRGLFHYCWTWQ